MINKVAKSMIDIFNVKYFVETGIHFGDQIPIVQGWLEEKNGQDYKIWEIDIEKKYVDLARSKYSHPNIEYIESDSAMAIESLISGGVFNDKSNVLFFLDAHWNEYWPLRDELSSIIKLTNKPIIAIDDFYNPFFPNSGGYDVYRGNVCGTKYIKDLVKNRTNLIVHAKEKQEYGYPGLTHPEQISGGQWCGFIFLDRNSEELFKKLKPIENDLLYEGLI